jgi:hypothetical protein
MSQNDNLIHENSFVQRYEDGDKRKKKAPMPVKTNEKDDLMLEIAAYMFNRDSKGGNLKFLAHVGLKVLLDRFTVEEWNYLTKGERVRTIQKRPDVESYLAKGNIKND